MQGQAMRTELSWLRQVRETPLEEEVVEEEVEADHTWLVWLERH